MLKSHLKVLWEELQCLWIVFCITLTREKVNPMLWDEILKMESHKMWLKRKWCRVLYCTIRWWVEELNERECYLVQKGMRRPGIEPRANAWKAFMLPLHHRRCLLAFFGCRVGEKCTLWQDIDGQGLIPLSASDPHACPSRTMSVNVNVQISNLGGCYRGKSSSYLWTAFIML